LAALQDIAAVGGREVSSKSVMREKVIGLEGMWKEKRLHPAESGIPDGSGWRKKNRFQKRGTQRGKISGRREENSAMSAKIQKVS